MPKTVPIERTVTTAELAGESARIERARTGQQLPRTLHALAMQGARLLVCPQCWQRQCLPCSVSGPPADHLARHMEAERRGLITRAELAGIVGQLDVIAPHVLVLDVTS
jgi:hypothetical protein